jgi:hypothetical protein
VKNVRRITSIAHLSGFALLLAGCSEHQPTSPNLGPKLGPAAFGSIIKSSVVTATTFCGPSGKCSTNTRFSEIAEKVGRAGGPRAMMGMSVGGDRTTSNLPQVPPAALKNLHISGRTLYADAVGKDGKPWHVELTHDAVAKGKISAMRLFSDGKLLFASNAKWKDVSGVWYHEHTDLTFYHKGRVGLHQEKSFSPLAVLPGNASDRSAATLTPSYYYGDGATSADDGSCPYDMPVCDWLRAGNPVQLLDSIVSDLHWAATQFATWFNGLFSGSGSDATAEMVEVFITTAHAINEPGLIAIAEAISIASSASISEAMMTEVATDVGEFIFDILLIIM